MSNIIVRNFNLDEFVVSAQSELSEELNGNITLKISITPNQVNNHFINDLDTMWEVDYYGDTFKIVYANKITKGTSFYLDVRAVHKGLDELDSVRTYERFDGYISAPEAFAKVFTGVSFSAILLDSFNSIEIEGLGDGETKLESFKRLLNRFKAEFYISGSTFYITKLRGRDTGFEYRYRLNLSNVSNEKDGSASYTYVKGFGDYGENDQDYIKTAKLKDEYESPLANILGRRHAPIVAKGSYKTIATLREAMKEVVDNSIPISVSADVKDLRKQGYPYAQPEVGDRVFINDNRIGLNQEIRVVEIVTQRYANGNVRDIKITFGNQRVRHRYASNLSSAMANLNALLRGEIELPFSTIDQVSKDMLRKIMSVDTELTLDNGIYAVDKNNPNNVVGLNSAGWFISNDGGNTAQVIATSNGIVANAITSGTLYTNLVTIVGSEGHMYMDGNELGALGKTGNSATFIRPSGLSIRRPDGAIYMENGVPKRSLELQRNQFIEHPVEFAGQNYRYATSYGGTSFKTFENFYGSHTGRYLRIVGGVSIGEDSQSNSLYMEVRLREFGTASSNHVGLKRVLARKLSSEPSNPFDIIIDLGPPTYEDIQFYLEFRATDATYDNIPQVRVGRVYLYG